MYPKSPPWNPMCVSEKQVPVSEKQMPVSKKQVPVSEKQVPVSEKTNPDYICHAPRVLFGYAECASLQDLQKTHSSQWHTQIHWHRSFVFIGNDIGTIRGMRPPQVHWQTHYIGTGCGTSPRITIAALKQSLRTGKVSNQASCSSLII